jgi:hypothetical protein
VLSIIDQKKYIREKCPEGNSQEDLKKIDKGKRNALSKETITNLESQLPEATSIAKLVPGCAKFSLFLARFQSSKYQISENLTNRFGFSQFS